MPKLYGALEDLVDWVNNGRKHLRVVNSQECFGDSLEIYHPVLRRARIVEFAACLVATEHDIGRVDISDRGTIKVLQCLVVHSSSERLDRGVDTSERQVFVENVGALFIELAPGTVALDARLNPLCKWTSTFQSESRLKRVMYNLQVVQLFHFLLMILRGDWRVSIELLEASRVWRLLLSAALLLLFLRSYYS